MIRCRLERFPRKLMATVLVAGFLGGCYSNTITSDRQITKDGWLSMHADVRVVRETRVSDDLMRVDVEVENTLPFDTRFNYQFEFVDAEGRQLFTPTTGFRQQQVPAGGFVTITATASLSIDISQWCGDFVWVRKM